jgi:hypothetical protein
MGSTRESDCSALLLDLLWYETVARRLSPEMEAILACHLSGCRVCRMRFDEFRAAHGSATVSPMPDTAPRIHSPS